jgi:rfaE bifunctional protein kinase chain/domain
VNARTRLHALLDGFAGRRVLLFGDLVVDRFILGTPKRISREAPVIILRFEEQRDLPGGGANAVANVAALGGEAVPVGVVGDDEAGRSLLALLASLAIDTTGVLVAPGHRTVTKVRLLAGGAAALRHQVARYDVECTAPDDAPWRGELLSRLTTLARDSAVAAVSDYGYGVVTTASLAALRASLPATALAVADSRFALRSLHGVDGATPNLEELAGDAGRDLASDADVARAAESLRAELGARFVAATRGNRGLTLVESGRPPLHLPAFGSGQVADVTGAGDTVLAALALSLAAGASPAEAAVLANLAGGAVVMKLGTATVSRDELHRAVELAPFLDE